MSAAPRILAFDTSGPWCVVSLGHGDVLVAHRFEEMGRGQAERLMPMIGEVLGEGGLDFQELDAIAVGIGPGNFTGVRIAVAAARGLNLGLRVPMISIDSFELRRDPDGPAAKANELVVIPAPRGRAYARLFRYGRPEGEPILIDPANPPESLSRVNLDITGEVSDEVAKVMGGNPMGHTPDMPRLLVKLADWKLAHGHDMSSSPAPLYIRPPDAAPPSDPPPVILP